MMWFVDFLRRSTRPAPRLRRSLVAAGLCLLCAALLNCSLTAEKVGDSGALSRKISLVTGADNSDVVVITRKNLGTTVRKGRWFVEFYTTWCPHCVRLQPTWEEVAKELKGEVNVGKVNCEADLVLCERFNVAGFPTLVYVDNQKARRYPVDNPRTKDALVNFARVDYRETPAYPPLRSPFGPVESTKAVLMDVILFLKEEFIRRLKQGTPLWVLCLTVVSVLVVATSLVAFLLVVNSKPKHD